MWWTRKLHDRIRVCCCSRWRARRVLSNRSIDHSCVQHYCVTYAHVGLTAGRPASAPNRFNLVTITAPTGLGSQQVIFVRERDEGRGRESVCAFNEVVTKPNRSFRGVQKWETPFDFHHYNRMCSFHSSMYETSRKIVQHFFASLISFPFSLQGPENSPFVQHTKCCFFWMDWGYNTTDLATCPIGPTPGCNDTSTLVIYYLFFIMRFLKLGQVFRGTSIPGAADQRNGGSLVLLICLLILSALSVLHHLQSNYHDR